MTGDQTWADGVGEQEPVLPDDAMDEVVGGKRRPLTAIGTVILRSDGPSADAPGLA